MAYLVVAYPKINDKDLEWIQNYREQNDPKYFSLIKPHFTLVFPIHDLDEHTFVEEIKKQTTDIKKINFEIKVATINLDDSGKFYHEFLVPDQGYSDIVKLHDKLYSGQFFKYLRFDIDFIPHIGIGNNEDISVSKKRIDEINQNKTYISGSIESLDIIEYKNNTIRTLQQINLN